MNKKKSIISVFAILIIFGIAEIIARSYGLGAPPLSRLHPNIEYYFKPSQDLNRFLNRIFINEYGMRSEDIDVSRPSDLQRRIAVFGDSVVFGGSQVDQDLIATSILQKRLREDGHAAEVLNISAGSWGPGNWRGYAKTYGFFDATDILLVISSHDATDNPSFAPLNPNTHPKQNPPFALYELLSRYFRPARVWHQLIGRRLRASPGAGSGESAIGSGEGDTRSEALRIGLADLSGFLNKAKESGARVAVVQFWDRREVESGQPGFGHSQIMELLSSRDIPTVQSLDSFRACSDNPARDLFVDGIHPYTLEGQECLANSLQLAFAEAGR